MEQTMTATDAARRAMVVSQLRTSAVSDSRVVAAMATVPRELFVPGEASALAYRDIALPLSVGRTQNSPLATGRLLTEAAIEPTDRVLLIGAAGGYTAAVLAKLATEVVAVESDPDLAAHARGALGGIANVTLVEGELSAGAADRAPYDVLIIDGAIEALPDTLVAQVRVGGRIAMGVLERGVSRLAVATHNAGGGIAPVPFADIDCVPLPGFDRPRAFHFPG